MPEEEIVPKQPVSIPASVTVKKLSELLRLPVATIITELMKNNILASINEEVDFDTASIIADDLGFEATPAEEAVEEGRLTIEGLDQLIALEKDSGKNLSPRPPIVTILGHVDHGKTTLLDTIRKTSVAAGEAGGITQHISAYQVKKHKQLITFVDTPGHEAFAAMRKRGLTIADIAILVVAADDGVRPQTKEVIEYLKEHKLPVIVAINKIDKPDAKPERVKQELAEHGILFEEWGGETMCTEISAKNNINIDKLLDNILLLAEVEDFRADTKRDGLAIVLESNLDPQKGPVATALVRTGTLKVGQDIVAGGAFGRIRRIEDWSGKTIETAGPSVPATIYGFNVAPQVNDVIQVVSGKSLARTKSKEAGAKKMTKIQEEDGEKQKLAVILKADVQGSLEAIEQILSAIQSDEVALNIISSGVGAITESDVKIAESAHALILGFNSEPTSVAKRMADGSGIEIETYNIIYKLVEAVKERLTSMLAPEIVRTDYGRLSVLAIFKTGKHDMIVGGRVSEGKLIRGSLIEIKRDDEIVGQGKMQNLQRNKENADEVGQGNECGVVFEGSAKIQVGDTLICYKEEEKKRTL
ncbi:MAG: translation initiation factor IF-2 [Candidatus Moranbacteria bacterium RIFCSPHIGHO2_12_FULL_54_9]|nr:MAG: translation initiation factor IF-2 [Candidatus Moranbacteria bacterium RIFCSPHIGHO2_01_FULL_54_31]OGI26105.1 MAG: translation initiation factor IF-2 [Candidatus Moranbacteria bacterium RIFCSPHIGHO2_12_FULL_54_9]